MKLTLIFLFVWIFGFNIIHAHSKLNEKVEGVLIGETSCLDAYDILKMEYFKMVKSKEDFISYPTKIDFQDYLKKRDGSFVKYYDSIEYIANKKYKTDTLDIEKSKTNLKDQFTFKLIVKFKDGLKTRWAKMDIFCVGDKVVGLAKTDDRLNNREEVLISLSFKYGQSTENWATNKYETPSPYSLKKHYYWKKEVFKSRVSGKMEIITKELWSNMYQKLNFTHTLSEAKLKPQNDFIRLYYFSTGTLSKYKKN